MTDRNPPPPGMTPPGWPPPERMAAIMEAIRRRIEEYRAEFDARDAERATRVPRAIT
jgi:hypothetical protein